MYAGYFLFILLGWATAGDWGVEVVAFAELFGVAGVSGKLLPKLDSTISSSNRLRLMDRELQNKENIEY